MSLAQQHEVHLFLESLHTTKQLDSAWLDQISEDDASIENTFQKEKNTGDLVNSKPNELFDLQRYNSGWSHPYNIRTIGFSAGQTKEGVLSQNCNPELTSPSGDDVSIKVLQAEEDRDCLEAVTSRKMSQDILNDQIQSSSSEKAIIASTGPCRSVLADEHPHYRLNPDDSVVHAHALVEGGGIRKIKKRSRPSRKPPTTILEADSANFRSVVQKLTGIPSSPLSSRQNLPGLSAELSTFRQVLISESSAGGIYVNSESQSEAHPFKYPFSERDQSVPFRVKPTVTVGISDKSTVKELCMGLSCSMQPQGQASGCSYSSSLLSSTRPSQRTCIRKSKD